MTSPFSTVEAFQQASDGPTEGAIYTFAHTPEINHIALLIAVFLFLWFLSSLSKNHSKLSRFEKSFSQLSVLIVAGLLSFVGHGKNQPTKPTTIPENLTDEC
ncbi:MAG: hypothetical protein AAFV85_17090 [Cyanobacteria bacterium J06634_6]